MMNWGEVKGYNNKTQLDTAGKEEYVGIFKSNSVDREMISVKPEVMIKDKPNVDQGFVLSYKWLY